MSEALIIGEIDLSTAPFMRVFVGDYLSVTQHLSTAEHGAYLLLLMAMFRAKGKLPADDDKLARIAKCTPDEWAKIWPTIRPFFNRRGGALSNPRVTEEVTFARQKSARAQKGGEATRIQKAYENSELASAKRKLPARVPEPYPDITPCSPPGDQQGLFGEDPPHEAPQDPVETAFHLWAQTAERCDFPKANDLTDKRRAQIKARLKECGGLPGWQAAMTAIEESPFLRGLVPGRNGQPPFRAHLDFVLQVSSFAKIRDGVYGTGAPLIDGPSAIEVIDPDILWENRLRAWRWERGWPWDTAWGPSPDQEGCRATPRAKQAIHLPPTPAEVRAAMATVDKGRAQA